MSETARVRLAKLIAALIVKLGKWERAVIQDENLEPGCELMRAQIQYGRHMLETNDPLGTVKAMEEIDGHHTDLEC